MPARILSISYDRTLLSSRQMLLERSGFAVSSAEGFVQALKRCGEGSYDLVVMGHSIPHEDKLALFEVITRECPVPVISLTRGLERDLPGAAATVDPFDQKTFLETVDRFLSQREKERRA